VLLLTQTSLPLIQAVPKHLIAVSYAGTGG
jgi:hypothetical protein